MATESLKSKSLKGVVWSGIDRVSYYGIQFIVNIILARMLTPDDYGVIGIILVFISFFNIFVDGGFSTALVRKINVDEDDFNTVWICNFVASALLYIVLIATSPIIASFYDDELIEDYLKVIGVVLPLSALAAIPLTKLTIDINFRYISISNISSVVVSGVFGIYLAYNGYGAWSLVYMYVLQYVIRCVILNVLKSWRPRFEFSKSSFVSLFSFSSKLVVSSLIDQAYNSLYPLVIGRYFSTKSLGLYTRGEQFGKLPVSIINEIFLRVTLPIMSSVQDDIPRLRNVYREYIRLSSFVIFGVMCWLVVIAKPLIILLLTEKWIESVFVMQILCVAMMTLHISSINRNLLYALGRSDLALKLEIIKKVSAIFIFVVSINYGLKGVCIGQLIYGVYAPSLNSYYTKSLINIDLLHQIIDYGSVWILAIISSVVTYIFSEMIDGYWSQIIFSTLVYLTVYIFLNAIFNTHAYNFVKNYLNIK